MARYLDEKFAKVYDHDTQESIVVLEWGKQFIWLQEGQDAVNTVLKTVKENGKRQLLALINAEGYAAEFLEWLVSDWYVPAHEAGLVRIAHKMGEELYGQLSAEQVAYEDESGILFHNFYEESDEEVLNWLLEK